MYQDNIGIRDNKDEIARIRDDEEISYRQFLIRKINQNGSLKIISQAWGNYEKIRTNFKSRKIQKQKKG